jgi:hypothetical protein
MNSPPSLVNTIPRSASRPSVVVAQALVVGAALDADDARSDGRGR